MKNILLSLLFGCFTLMAEAQTTEIKIPEKVISSFIQKYPKAKEVEWKIKDSLYKVDFDNDELGISITFDENANITKTKEEIKLTDIPQSIKDYVKKKLKNKTITAATKKTNEKGEAIYKIEIGKNDYVFDEKGNLIPVEK